MLRTDVENRLILVITQLEVLFGAVEVFFEHGDIVVGQSVINGKITVIVYNVRPWSNLINNLQLHMNANHMLNRLPLIVLLSSCLEEFIISAEPIEYGLVTIPSAFEKRIFTKVVSHLQSIVLFIGEYLEHI